MTGQVQWQTRPSRRGSDAHWLVDVATQAKLPALAESARSAFVHGMSATLWTCCAIAALGLVLALAFLPRRTGVAEPEPEEVATIGL